jgi:hypothetical protein
VFKVISVFNTPLCSVEDVISAIHNKDLKKHPNYKIFLAHLKEFFMLGRPEYASKYGVKPHLIQVKEWVSAFSYVLAPDLFLGLCHYVSKNDHRIMRKLYSSLFNLLSSPQLHLNSEISHKSHFKVTATDNQTTDVTLFTFAHGSADSIYPISYAKAIAEIVQGDRYDALCHEVDIDKTSEKFRPIDLNQCKKFDAAQNVMSIFKQSHSLGFARADYWYASIRQLYHNYPQDKFNFSCSVIMRAGHTFSGFSSLKSNVLKNPHLHAWATLTDFLVLEKKLLPDFYADRWLWNILMAADLAISVHEHISKNEPSTLLMCAGIAHHYHLALFIHTPSSLYHLLTQVFNQVRQDTGGGFEYDSVPSPPVSSSQLVDWALSIK